MSKTSLALLPDKTTFTECILMMREDPSPHSSWTAAVTSDALLVCLLDRSQPHLTARSDNDGIDQLRDPGNGRHDVIARIGPCLYCFLILFGSALRKPNAAVGMPSVKPGTPRPSDLEASPGTLCEVASSLQLCIDPPVPPLLLPGHSFDDKNGVFLPFNPDRLSMRGVSRFRLKRFARWKIRNANPRDTVPEGGPRDEPVRVLFDEATLQALREPQQEPARISLDEIRRTLHGLDRQRAEERARRGQGVPQQEATALQPRNGKAIVPLEEIVGTLDDLERQRAEARARPRASDTEPVRRPNTPEMTLRPPQTPPSRKRRGERQEGLLTPVTPPPSGQGRPRKRPRLPHEAVQFQQRSVDAILQHRESCFGAQKDASVGRSWCKEVPLALQVETSKSFYEAFTDERTLPISHCIFCYRKFPPARLTILQWRECLTPWLVQATTALQKCEKCLPSDADPQVDICLECRAGFERGKLPKACSVNNMDIGCEHRYPKELDGLSPLEERLIALQAPFGYITKFTVDNKTPSGVGYRKHVKGHIVVFLNNTNDLVATVLPHPLLQTVENIHVSWSGANRPSPADVGTLLRVRKSRVIAALLWLQRNNPLYKDVKINLDEIRGWKYAEGSVVPAVLMERMQREDLSAVERTHTDPVVPNIDRGLEENGFTSIEELLTSLRADPSNDTCPSGSNTAAEQPYALPRDLHMSAPNPESADQGGDIPHRPAILLIGRDIASGLRCVPRAPCGNVSSIYGLWRVVPRR
ncbi:hypothetical protein HRG_012529 [Hirsutella rhossiliensis]